MSNTARDDVIVVDYSKTLIEDGEKKTGEITAELRPQFIKVITIQHEI